MDKIFLNKINTEVEWKIAMMKMKNRLFVSPAKPKIMRNLTHCLLRSLALAIPFFGMSASSSGQEAMPETIKHLYCQEMDMRISDEFDTYLEWDIK